ATIRLALSLTAQFHISQLAPAARNNPAFLESLNWVPLLFAAYLFFAPWKHSHTSRVVFWYSVALLLCGLIPGDGYLYIAALLFFYLCMAIGFALVRDCEPQKAAPARPAARRDPGAPVRPAFS